MHDAFSFVFFDFMTDEKEHLGVWISYKLRYSDTDVFRYVVASMRVV